MYVHRTYLGNNTLELLESLENRFCKMTLFHYMYFQLARHIRRLWYSPFIQFYENAHMMSVISVAFSYLNFTRNTGRGSIIVFYV